MIHIYRIRQPIISVLAHVDHGKTSLLDYIRGSTVAAKEAGGITQHIGATEVPIEEIKSICGSLFEKWNLDVKFPGLLFIDTPGHAIFTPLRKRGGSLADIAVVVIDIREGIMPQTDEVFTILKQHKTPFVIAANKIDIISGWQKNPGMCFLETYDRQRTEIQQHLDTKIYELIGQLYNRGFSAERFDRVEDFTKQISIVPISAVTGEGVPELLTVLSGLTQRYLEKKLEINPQGPGKGTVLEVKEIKGLGTTIDVILYDGLIRVGDTLVIGNPGGAIKTKVKALLKAQPMKDIRVERQFMPFSEVTAASGIKISAPGIESVIPGVPVISMRDDSDTEKAEEEVNRTIEAIAIETENEGVLIKTDAIGSLEAIVTLLKNKGVPIKKAGIGQVTRRDVTSIKAVDEKLRVIFAFNSAVFPEAEEDAKLNKVKIFSNRVIYRLLEDYDEHIKKIEELKKQDILATVTRPAHIKQVEGFVFRQSNPAIAGFDILSGVLREKVRLMKRDGTIIGEIKQIQDKGENVKEAKIGSRVAISIDGAVIGRNIKEGDELFTFLLKEDYQTLSKNKELMSGDEINTLELIREIMVKKDKYWDIG